MSTRQQAIIIVPAIIGIVAGTFGVLGYYVVTVFGIPKSLGIPGIIRDAGFVVLALGLYLMGWIFRYRQPTEILISTYVSMLKAVRLRPLGEASSGRGPLILEGPQLHVRHPMYFAVVVFFLGWWLIFDYTFLLFTAFFFFLWFNVVVIPFEEKELKALYREKYEAYAKAVPRFFPSLKRRW